MRTDSLHAKFKTHLARHCSKAVSVFRQKPSRPPLVSIVLAPKTDSEILNRISNARVKSQIELCETDVLTVHETPKGFHFFFWCFRGCRILDCAPLKTAILSSHSTVANRLAAEPVAVMILIASNVRLPSAVRSKNSLKRSKCSN